MLRNGKSEKRDVKREKSGTKYPAKHFLFFILRIFRDKYIAGLISHSLITRMLLSHAWLPTFETLKFKSQAQMNFVSRTMPTNFILYECFFMFLHACVVCIMYV